MTDPTLGRRWFLGAAGAAGISACATPQIALGPDPAKHGLIGKLIAVSGRRDELIGILLAGVSGMAGCLSYIVSCDAVDPDAIWITEVWVDEASHLRSLALPSVQEAIRLGRPLIAGFGDRFVTVPVGGHGLQT